jgi:hypothetical protein
VSGELIVRRRIGQGLRERRSDRLNRDAFGRLGRSSDQISAREARVVEVVARQPSGLGIQSRSLVRALGDLSLLHKHRDDIDPPLSGGKAVNQARGHLRITAVARQLGEPRERHLRGLRMTPHGVRVVLRGARGVPHLVSAQVADFDEPDSSGARIGQPLRLCEQDARHLTPAPMVPGCLHRGVFLTARRPRSKRDAHRPARADLVAAKWSPSLG